MNKRKIKKDHLIKGMAVVSLLLAVMTSLLGNRILVQAAETGETVLIPADTDGLETVKSARDNGDGTYTITLEQYATGSTVQTSMPADVVLVLDRSGSMNNFQMADGQTRTAHMKATVNDFIAHMASVNAALEEDRRSRLGMITYSDGADILMNMGEVTSDTAASYQNAVNNIPIGGRTRTDLGMQLAVQMLDGDTRTPNQVVIVFTDGWPNRNDGFQPWTADAAIGQARIIKEKGGRVFSLCIEDNIRFSDGDPLAEYQKRPGDRGDTFTYVSQKMHDIGVTGDVNATDEQINCMTNRFFNLMSSNYPHAANLDEQGYGGKTLWPVVGSYYKTAHDQGALDAVFTMLKTTMTMANTTLGAQAQLRDYVTEDFEIVTENGIRTYLVPALPGDGGLVWGEREQADCLNVQVEGQEVCVSGFDYSGNYVSVDGHYDDPSFHGNKLVVEFDIRPKAIFGANALPTNMPNSGIYPSAEATEAVEYYTVPVVNVRLDYEITASNVYAVRPDSADLTKIPGILEEYTPNGVNNQYVTIDYTMTEENGELVATRQVPPAVRIEDTQWQWVVTQTEVSKTYVITALVTPVKEGEYPPLVRTVTADAIVTEAPVAPTEVVHTSKPEPKHEEHHEEHHEEQQAEPAPTPTPPAPTALMVEAPAEAPEPSFMIVEEPNARQVATGDHSALVIWGVILLGGAVSLILWKMWETIHRLE